MITNLDDKLREIAEALTADAPDVPAFDEQSETTAPAPRRWVPLSAAAAVAVLGIGGLIVAGRGGHDDPASTEVASAPPTISPTTHGATPTLYPVINDLPDNAAAECRPADDTSANAAALIGEMGDDGAVLSTLQVRAGVRFGQELEHVLGPLVEGTSVFGVAGSLYENSELGGPAGTRTVVWGTPPNFNVSIGAPYLMLTGQPAIAGADPLEFLEAASPDFVTFTITDEAGPVDMTIGDLPEGFELLAGPQSLGGSSTSTSAILRVTPSGSFVQTTTFDPLLQYGNVGPREQVDINDHDGWVDDDGRVVVWQVDESTWAKAVALEQGGGVALAETVTFVDRATWVDLYDPQFFPTGPAFTPITGPIEYPDPSDTTGPEPVPVSMP